MEEVLQQALTGPADERDVTLARMGDILQATAQGLSPRAAAVWAGVPEPVLQTWIEKDPAFAAAFAAARALASAHATCPGKQHTPAMLRAMLVAMSTGATMLDALKLAGFSEYRFRLLSRSSPVLESLLAAARSARPSRRSVYVPGTYRPRRPGRKPPPQGGFRLVRRSTSRAEPEED
ncbi:hypothetical protein [Streptomyces sp. PTY087I2]|uniref:hypothetical protein n=1 Tax=Streptomyces sp. PTY087I2 TaxID=1819298 RepID=UPI00114CEFEA|nr:hypothetical protein [Streptomyces sp. PTY087I2]